MEGTLKFDDRVVDTKLAEAYLKEHNFKFNSIGVNSEDHFADFAIDKAGNKIFYNHDVDLDIYNRFDENTLTTTSEMRKEMRNLATIIEENGELFAQLEALIRKKHKDEVKNVDIKIISQNFLHCSQSRSQYEFTSGILLIKQNDGLYTLGFVARILSYFGHVCIVSDKETAAVCYLFTELCRQAGLEMVTLIIREGINNDTAPPEGVGIIANSCDVESAVDAFLFSSTKYPWSLRSILIQETVYEEVKKIFAWKCKNSTTEAALNALNPSLKQSSTEVFLYDEKLFMFDYVGDHEQIEASQQVVLIEAYRTTKELMSLVKSHAPFSISLWSSDVAEANEIAFGADVNMVWVNEFGVFDGPPAASQAVFSPWILKKLPAYNIVFKSGEILKLKTWSELSVRNRIKKITAALEAFKIENKDEDSIKHFQESEESMVLWKSDNFVDVQKGKLYIGRVVPVDVVFCNIEGNPSPNDIITTLINGQGIVFTHGNSNEPARNLMEFFETEQLPVFHRDPAGCWEKDVNASKVMSGLNISQTRVVCTNFGTIFAN